MKNPGYVEISRSADETIKDCIIHDSKFFTEADLVHTFEERKLISGKLASNNNNELLIHDKSSTR